MSREDFLRYFDDELDQRKQEYKEAQYRIGLYKKIIPTPDEVNTARFLAVSATQRLKDIKSLWKFPLMARIEASSDAEIEDYRKSKIEKLESEMQGFTYEIDSLEAQRKSLDQERMAFITGFLTLDKNDQNHEREVFEKREFELQSEADRLDKKIREDKGHLYDVREELKFYKNSSVEEIKENMVQENSSIKNRKRKNAIDFSSPIMTKDVELLASVAFDRDKSARMLELLAEHKRLIETRDSVHENVDLSGFGFNWHFFYSMVASKYAKDGHDHIIEVYNAEGLKRDLKQYIIEYDDSLELYKHQFTYEKLKRLRSPGSTLKYGFEDNMEEEVNFLIEKHSDKISESDLNSLKTQLNIYKKLQRKIIKTRSTQWDMEYHLNSIHDLYCKLMKDVYTWYCENSEKVHNIIGENFRTFHDRIIADIKFGRMDIRIQKQCEAQNYLDKELDRIDSIIKARREVYNPSIRFVESQIRRLAGPGFEDTDLTPLRRAKGTPEEIISNAVTKKYEEELADRVYTAARKDADETESKLTGKTIEQLMQERRRELENQKAYDDDMIKVTREEGERQKELANERKDAPVNKYGISYTDLGYRLVKSPEIKEEDIAFKNNPANVSYETEISDKIQDIIDEIKDDPIIRKRKM